MFPDMMLSYVANGALRQRDELIVALAQAKYFRDTGNRMLSNLRPWPMRWLGYVRTWSLRRRLTAKIHGMEQQLSVLNAILKASVDDGRPLSSFAAPVMPPATQSLFNGES